MRESSSFADLLTFVFITGGQETKQLDKAWSKLAKLRRKTVSLTKEEFRQKVSIQ